MKKLSFKQESEIVVRLARGDSRKAIQQHLAENAVNVSIDTIGDIKKRNLPTIMRLRTEVEQRNISRASSILYKSHNLIEKRLDKLEEADVDREILLSQYLDGEIDYKEYTAKVAQLPQSTLSELTGVAREAFNQSQIEQGKPTSISSPEQTQNQLKQIAEAINRGDEIELQRIIFKADSAV